VILMKKKTEDAEGNDDIEEAFRVFDTKNDE
jgi:Ca2+-binding EF-hand superfamily protein